jgi:hypothetical protein
VQDSAPHAAVCNVLLACRGKAALQAAENVLKLPELAGLQLYSFRAAAKRDRLYIRLDKVRDIAVNATDIQHCLTGILSCADSYSLA